MYCGETSCCPFQSNLISMKNNIKKRAQFLIMCILSLFISFFLSFVVVVVVAVTVRQNQSL